MKIRYTAHRHDSKIGTIEDVRDDFARQLIATGCAVAAPRRGSGRGEFSSRRACRRNTATCRNGRSCNHAHRAQSG